MNRHPAPHRNRPQRPPRQEGGPNSLGRDESGSIIVFSLFVMVIMLMIGGLGVDIMRTEARRTELQATLDRAVLAAADLQQTRDPETVVRDYVAKAGMSDSLGAVEVVQALNMRTVRAEARSTVPTMMLKFAGMTSLAAPAAASATESVNDIEIGLVLDVSGSMNSNNRLPRLKTAGAEFIDTMFNTVEPGHLAISLVPYSTQVNLGLDLATALGMPRLHNFSYCADLPATAYLTTVASPLPLVQAGHFDSSGFSPSSGGISSYANMRMRSSTCRTGNGFEVLPWSTSRTALKNRIAGLSAEGWTSIEMGVNWGAALLDPTVRTALNQFSAVTGLASGLTGWPRDFGISQGMKVLVVMTDGANTVNYRLKSPYRENGLSDVWVLGSNDYYVKRLTGDYFRASDRTIVATRPALATRLRWNELFARMTVREHAHHLRAMQFDQNTPAFDTAFATWTSIVETDWTITKDTRLSQICSAAKAKGVVIFTIGFEINEPGAMEAMAGCASSPSHFYRVEGLQIASAFTSIATQINALRLIQ